MSLLAAKLKEAQDSLLENLSENAAAWDQPEAWDWSTEPEPPIYLADRLIEQGTIVTLTADTGAGKSWNAQALSVSVATGTPFLGRAVRQGTVLYVDEENPVRIPRSRMRALGMTNAHGGQLVYYSRKGFALGDATANQKLIEKIKEHGATLVVIDTLMAATNVAEINSNDGVVAFYKSMRAVTEATGVTVLILHHERKPQEGKGSGSGYSAMGARQIAGQSDGHLTLQLKEKSVTGRPDGGSDYRTVLVLRDAKDRDGATVVPGGEVVVIESHKDTAGRLVKAAVFSEGPARTDSEELADGVLDEIIDALTAEPGHMLKRGELAAQLNRKTDDRTFKAGLAAGTESGRIVKPKHGCYGLVTTAPEGVPI